MALHCLNRSHRAASIASLTGGGQTNFSNTSAATFTIPLVRQLTRSRVDNSLASPWEGTTWDATFQAALLGPTLKLPISIAVSVSVWILWGEAEGCLVKVA